MILRKISLLAALILVLVVSQEAFCSEGMGISPEYFLKKMGYACVKVKNGLSSVTIASGIQETAGYKQILECGNRIMLVLTGSDDGRELMSVALLYYMDLDPDEIIDPSVSRSYENSRFENICRQMIFSLDNGISDSDAEKALRSIGIHGNMLDGIQRSSSVKGYSCMLKLQPGGMLMMVISKI